MKKMLILLLVFGFGSGILLAQSFNLKIGLFVPSLQSDLWEENMRNLAFDKTDMIEGYYGAEFEFSLNHFTSLSMEIGTYSKSVSTQYKYYFYPDGRPIFQNISLRITPMEANIKIYPLGHSNMVSPYFGAGAGLYAWTYEQWGDFVIFPDAFIEEGFAETRTFSLGLNGRAGLVFRFHPRLALSFEGKYRYLRGRLSGYFEGFELLDLGGISATFGVNIYMR